MACDKDKGQLEREKVCVRVCVSASSVQPMKFMVNAQCETIDDRERGLHKGGRVEPQAEPELRLP